MIENPTDPLESKYAPSFLTAFRSACEIIGISKRPQIPFFFGCRMIFSNIFVFNAEVYEWVPEQTGRWRQLYVQLFSSTVIPGHFPQFRKHVNDYDRL
jgi:hypothetical protein